MNQQEPSHCEQKGLDLSNLLEAEFNYIAQSAFQANEDRARASQFFFLMFTTLIAAIYSTQLTNVDYKQVYKAFSFVFLTLVIFGVLTLLQLARLRLAWRESILAMNALKELVITRFPTVGNHFRWNSQSIPPAFKLNSIGCLIAFMVSLLSGISAGSSLIFLQLSSGNNSISWNLSILVGTICSIVVFLAFYWLPLKKTR